jgi:hypothetical protein
MVGIAKYTWKVDVTLVSVILVAWKVCLTSDDGNPN